MSGRWVPVETDLAAFVYHEAELLDRRRFDEWLALFAGDGRYWLPLFPDQTDFMREQSLLIEDRLLLEARVERLKSGKAPGDNPKVTCQHVLQAPRVEEHAPDANRYRTRTPFLYVELRREEQQFLAGTASHLLRVEEGRLRIVEKRVDLLAARTALPAIFLMP